MNHDTCRALDQYADLKPAPLMLRPDDYIPPRPIPISERLPKPYYSNVLGLQDCSASDQCCWWWDVAAGSWRRWHYGVRAPYHTHWLPHWALPLPEVES